MLEISLSNFRVHQKFQHSYPNGTITLINGRSGVGKTTIMEAIYWCCYGKIVKIKPYDQDKAVTIVSLKFKNSQLDLEITRTSKASKLEVKDNKSNSFYRGEVAQEYINFCLGTFDFFNSSFYIAQRAFHVLLVGSKANKLTYIDRLAFKNQSPEQYIEKVIKDISEVANIIKNMERDVDIQEQTIKIQMKRHNISELPDELISLDFKEEIMNCEQEIEKHMQENNNISSCKNNIQRYLIELEKLNFDTNHNMRELILKYTDLKEVNQYQDFCQDSLDILENFCNFLDKELELCQQYLEFQKYNQQLIQLENSIESITSLETYPDDGSKLIEYTEFEIKAVQVQERNYRLQQQLASNMGINYDDYDFEYIQKCVQKRDYYRDLCYKIDRKNQYLQQLEVAQINAQELFNLDLKSVVEYQSLRYQWNAYEKNMEIFSKYPDIEYSEESLQNIIKDYRLLNEVKSKISEIDNLCKQKNIERDQITNWLQEYADRIDNYNYYSPHQIEEMKKQVDQVDEMKKICQDLNLTYQEQTFKDYNYNNCYTQYQILDKAYKIIVRLNNLINEEPNPEQRILDLQVEQLEAQRYQQDRYQLLSVCLSYDTLHCPNCNEALRLENKQLISIANFNPQTARKELDDIRNYRQVKCAEIQSNIQRVNRINQEIINLKYAKKSLNLNEKYWEILASAEAFNFMREHEDKLTKARILNNRSYIELPDISPNELELLNLLRGIRSSFEFCQKNDYILDKEKCILDLYNFNYVAKPEIELEKIDYYQKLARDKQIWLKIQDLSIPQDLDETQLELELKLNKLEPVIKPLQDSEKMRKDQVILKQRQMRSRRSSLESNKIQIINFLSNLPKFYPPEIRDIGYDRRINRAKYITDELEINYNNLRVLKGYDLDHDKQYLEELRNQQYYHQICSQLLELNRKLNESKYNLTTYQTYINKLSELRDKMVESEYISYINTTNNINSYLDDIMKDIFSDSENPISASISMFRQLISNDRIKPEVNIVITRGGIEISSKQISGGEFQRLSLALTLACIVCFDPPLVMLDEFLPGLSEVDQLLCVEMVSKYIRDKDRVVICTNHGGISGWYDRVIDL